MEAEIGTIQKALQSSEIPRLRSVALKTGLLKNIYREFRDPSNISRTAYFKTAATAKTVPKSFQGIELTESQFYTYTSHLVKGNDFAVDGEDYRKLLLEKLDSLSNSNGQNAESSDLEDENGEVLQDETTKVVEDRIMDGTEVMGEETPAVVQDETGNAVGNCSDNEAGQPPNMPPPIKRKFACIYDSLPNSSCKYQALKGIASIEDPFLCNRHVQKKGYAEWAASFGLNPYILPQERPQIIAKEKSKGGHPLIGDKAMTTKERAKRHAHLTNSTKIDNMRLKDQMKIMQLRYEEVELENSKLTAENLQLQIENGQLQEMHAQSVRELKESTLALQLIFQAHPALTEVWQMVKPREVVNPTQL